MDEQIEELQNRLEAANLRIRREQQLRLHIEAQRRRAEIDKRYLEAHLRPRTLRQALQDSHECKIQGEFELRAAVTSATMDPGPRVYPRRITPSPDFDVEQARIWELLSASGAFQSEHSFISAHPRQQVHFPEPRSIIGDTNLHRFVSRFIEDFVMELVKMVLADKLLCDKLGINGSVRLQSHGDFGESDSDSESDIDPKAKFMKERYSALPVGSAKRRKLSRASAKAGDPDNCFIFTNSEKEDQVSLAIQYKAQHNLSTREIVTGLRSEIQPDRDVINKDGDAEDYEFSSQRLTAAIVTQLFSHMIAARSKYGYVCTGEAFIFLHVPEDPSICHYSVCVPRDDVASDAEFGLHRTAVAQVFAFLLRALRDGPPSSSWSEEAAGLDTWVVEYDDVLSKIPYAIRNMGGPYIKYEPASWKGLITRSPILVADQSVQMGTDETTIDIREQPFCTQQCLWGLACGGPLDQECPNIKHHKSRHLDPKKFRRLMRTQLARDSSILKWTAGMPLDVAGSLGTLFKILLPSHGYTLVAKAVNTSDACRLLYENDVYSQADDLQGIDVPVCLGFIHVDFSHFSFNGSWNDYFLFLSWAGEPLDRCIKSMQSQEEKTSLLRDVEESFRRLHKAGILHGDTGLRNLLYDKKRNKVTIVDFDRSLVFWNEHDEPSRYPPTSRRISLVEGATWDDVFAHELQKITSAVSRRLENDAVSSEKDC